VSAILSGQKEADLLRSRRKKSGWPAVAGWLIAAAFGFAAALLIVRLHILPREGSDTVATPGPVDIGFAQFMTAHHDQAVTLCQIVLSRGNSKLNGLANAILVNQLLEMGQMRGWLSLWNQALMPTRKHMDWMLKGKVAPDAATLRYLSDCNAAPGGMLGLASMDELNRLGSLEGGEQDRLFLELMIRHHQGALPMARFAAQNADTSLVRGLAALTVIEQSKEIDSMQMILRQPTEAEHSGQPIH
jgi:uncharacterized protein (DUF305 family)